MLKLSQTQLVLLSHAIPREDGNLLPLPETLPAPRCAVEASIGALLKRNLVEEFAVLDEAHVWRATGEARLGVRLVDAGRSAVVLPSRTAVTDRPIAAAPKKQKKAALVFELLQREGGATINELMAVTGWLPHTTRAALTGLRKKGHVLDKTKRDGATCYSIPVVG